MNLQNLKGVGNKTIESLYQASIYTINDLLTYYPYRYQILVPTILDNSKVDETIVINAAILEVSKVGYIKKNLNVLRMKIETNGKIVSLVIYNRAFLKSNLKIGQHIIATGKYNIQKNLFTASNIRFGILTEKKIIPVYHSIKNIKNVVLEKIIEEGLKENNLEDYIPSKYLNKYNFIAKKDAIELIHKPDNEENLKKARERLIYEELFLFLFKVQYLKKIKTSEETIIKKIDKKLIAEFINDLPFKLTSDQLKSINEGIEDFTSKKRMNRLLLGDVGSGKTIVATVLIYANFLARYQSAFMAPTEILATQHYESIKKLFEQKNINVKLLIGSMSNKNKNDIIKLVNEGKVDVLIGTHAILNENIIFPNLGFVITDEQHRFGVNQRNILQEKGVKPDVLFMSATPIPRTYALTIYGDMDISTIKTLPSGRKPIQTFLKDSSQIKEVLMMMYEQLKQGHQIYVISPLIEESETLDLTTVNDLKNKMDIAFQNKYKVGVVHGKLRPIEKDKIMKDFLDNKIQILISTTVIEVGVDVPNTTMIVIFDANRFGLASLHQLRGRVGRSDLQSSCVLISDTDAKRLDVMTKTNDGFEISEEDFKIRGHGDLFGTKQSGDMSFKIADVKQDYKILLQAKKDSLEYLTDEKYATDSLKKMLIDNIQEG